MSSVSGQLDLLEFLPAYSGIDVEKNDPLYAFYGDRIPDGAVDGYQKEITQEFYGATYLKKEFNDLKLLPTEAKKRAGAPFEPLNNQEFMARFMSPLTPYDRMLVFQEVGSGKCHSFDTPILMHDGSIKVVQDVVIGDYIMGDDSSPRRVLSLGRGREDMFLIKQKNGGDDYGVNKSHILSLKVSGQKSVNKVKTRGLTYIIGYYFNTQTNKRESKWFPINDNEDECRAKAQEWVDSQLDISSVDMELADYMALPKYAKTYYKGFRVGVEFKAQKLPLDPYFLGVWLGDGTSSRTEITSNDEPIIQYLLDTFPEYDIKARTAITYHISPKEDKGKVRSNGILNILKDLNLFNNKHIPQIYKVNSRTNRLKLLAGLLDTDGYLSESYGYEIIQKRPELAKDILFLARSLGFRAQIKEVQKTCTNAPGGPKVGTYHMVTISGHLLHEIPVLLERKKCPITKPNKNQLCGSIDIVPLGVGDYYGFELDGNNRYLLGDFTVTHNTCLASVVSEMAQATSPSLGQTLILVKNSTLANNIMNEIATICTNGKYLPIQYNKAGVRISPQELVRTKDENIVTYDEKGEKLTEETLVRRLHKAIRKNFEIETFGRFAKYLSEQSLDTIQQTYSNRYIIIDEAHNLRIQPRKTEVSIYNQIYCFLHTVQNTKQLLMTATPIRDRPIEIGSLLNLLLPSNKQFRMDTFMEDWFDHNGFREDKRAEFKERIRGIISYVRSTSADVRKIYEGRVIDTYLEGEEAGMQKMKLVKATMSKLQTKAYKKAYNYDRRMGNGPEAENIDEQDDIVEEGDDDAGNSALYQHSRQASMFVAPDGAYGPTLEKKWVILSKEEMDTREAAKKKKGKKGKVSEEDKILVKLAKKKPPPLPKTKKGIVRPLGDRLTRVSDALKSWIYYGENGPGEDEEEEPSDETKLKNLSELSSKYAGTIRALIEYPTEKAFVYSNLVAGSGTNLFAAILELFEFTHVSLPDAGKGATNMKIDKYRGKRHFILITGKFPTARQSQILVNKVFNYPPKTDEGGNRIDPGNLYGDYIQVIVASRIVGEGVSFKGARQFHNLTPGWNETERSQAQGRIVRAFAHDGFSPEEKYVRIFNWCAMPKDHAFPSVDFKMYKVSEDKDFPNKQIERLLKEAAVDCSLNVARNQRPDLDNARDGSGERQVNSRECDYTDCVYACDSIPQKWYPHWKKIAGEWVMVEGIQQPLIKDSFNLFYAVGQIDEIKEELRVLFRTRFSYDFFELKRLLPKPTEIILIRALKEMIDQSEPITNRYGITSYMRESGNFYFLVDNQEFIHTANLYLLAHYNEHPILKEEISFTDYVSFFEMQYLEEKIDKLADLNLNEATAADITELGRSFQSFGIRVQEELLEGFLQAEKQDLDTNVPLRKAFLALYRGFIHAINRDLVISSLMVKDLNVLRCYDVDVEEDQWRDCSVDDADTYRTRVAEVKEKLKGNPYGYYGNIGKDKKGNRVLKIATVKPPRINKSGKNKGKVDARIEGEGTVCGTQPFSTGNLVALFIRFGEIAESLGQEPPSFLPFLSQKQIDETEAKATPKEVDAMLRDKRKKLYGPEGELEEQILPEFSLEELTSSSPEKLQRLYSILKYPNVKKIHCPTLEEFFKTNGLLRGL